MGSDDVAGVECPHRVPVPPARPFLDTFRANLKETFFPDDPFRQFKQEKGVRRALRALQYFLPILEWAPSYTFSFFRADLIAGITIASLAIPQGISYAKLANLPPVLGLYSSFVPPLLYSMMGELQGFSGGDGGRAVSALGFPVGEGRFCCRRAGSLSPPGLHLHLLRRSFAGRSQFAEQLKGIMGLVHFTTSTDLISVLESIFTQVHQWRWQSVVLGVGFLTFLLTTRFLSKKGSLFFWISAAAPLTSVVLGSLLVFATRAENHGVEVIGHLKKGLNPPSLTYLIFSPPYMMVALKTGMIIGIIGLAEGIAVGRSFSMFKNYHIDGNKEMIAFGTMNMVGSLTSCYLTTGALFEVGGELQCGLQDGDVERRHGRCSDDHTVVPHTPVSLHPFGGPLLHHHLRHARPH
ncbi:hypothetical protein HPP92_023234 [Vanilla planifolia]|uniref:SLC26A/SulP transporter domain-containing protein n=1 Tax=Vanilla planifolia TaxID=51239 RepID=A0A835UI03_VANPL|nr:hypothetical protein HPP92_023234 [Vanilla planifolia]